jgi:hypothetical protein
MSDEDRTALAATDNSDPCRYGAAKFHDVMALDDADPTLFCNEDGTFTCQNCSLVEKADTSFVCNYCGAHVCPDCVVAHSKACYSEHHFATEIDHEGWKKKYFCHFFEQNRCRNGAACKYSHDPDTKNNKAKTAKTANQKNKKNKYTEKENNYHWCAEHGKRRADEFLEYDEIENTYHCRPSCICRGSHDTANEEVPKASLPPKLTPPATSLQNRHIASASSGPLPIDNVRPEEERKAEKDAAKREKEIKKKEKKEKDEAKREKAKGKKKIQ